MYKPDIVSENKNNSDDGILDIHIAAEKLSDDELEIKEKFNYMGVKQPKHIRIMNSDGVAYPIVYVVLVVINYKKIDYSKTLGQLLD